MHDFHQLRSERHGYVDFMRCIQSILKVLHVQFDAGLVEVAGQDFRRFWFMTFAADQAALIASNTNCGSTPALVANAKASLTAAILTTTIIWFANFVTLPAPTSPTSG